MPSLGMDGAISKHMKIVIFGLTISSSWGNGHATLWRGLCRALAHRGHTVVFFERDVPYYAAHRDLREWRDGELCLYREWHEAQPLARRHADEADVAIVTSYCADGVAATNLVLESTARIKSFYDLDTPVTLEALDSGRAVSYLGPRALGEFDLVLSYTGGRALDALRERLGARRVTALYGSVDPEVHRRVAPVEHFRADLSYLGTYAEDRQPTLETLLIGPARRLPQRRFVIAGAQYPQAFPWTDNIFFVRHLEPAQHPAFFASSRLTLNVTRRAMKEMGYCPSGRLFEAAACGAPILSDYWEGLELFFEPGAEIIVARDSNEAAAAIQLPYGALQEIARRARERVLAQHTAEQRAKDFEKIIAAARPEMPAGNREVARFVGTHGVPAPAEPAAWQPAVATEEASRSASESDQRPAQDGSTFPASTAA
jgi:spore maturation protein CgeB